MKISQISTYNTKTVQPNFQSYSRVVRAANGNMLYRTSTTFFRDDLSWYELIPFLEMKYKNANKVNIINHACSNGEETYSLVIKFLDVLGEKSKKYLPVIARDVDNTNIKLAQKGEFEIEDEEELMRLRCHSCYSLNDYFDIEKPKLFGDNTIIRPKKCLTDNVRFAQGNILEDVKKIPTSNTVLLCRNFWPYLPPKDREYLAKELGKRLDNTCTIITGMYDQECANIYNLLGNNGFRSTIFNIFEKEPTISRLKPNYTIGLE